MGVEAIDHALSLARQGFLLIPVQPFSKRPIGENWPERGTSSEAEIRSWWRLNPDSNFGIILGAKSRMIVFDVDGADGDAALEALEKKLGPLPESRQHSTARGCHLFFSLPPGVHIKRRIKLGPKLDLMADGSQVLGPGSVHPGGSVYTVRVDHSLAELPQPWIEYLSRRDPPDAAPPPRGAPSGELTAYQRGVRDNSLERMRGAEEGERNNLLNRLAYGCAQYGVPRHEVEADLKAVAISKGLTEAEVKASFESGWASGAAKPKEPPLRVVSSTPRRFDDGPNGREVDPSEAPAGRGSDGDWKSRFLLGKGGALKASAGNALLILSNDPALTGVFGHDVFRNIYVVVGQPPWEVGRTHAKPLPRLVADADAHELGLWIEGRYSVAFAVKALYEAILAAASLRPFDDLRAYLEGLKWDGVERLDSWLSDYLGAENSMWTQAVGRRWMIQAAKRALHPGCKADYVLVLEGEQGRLKSQCLAALAGPEFFSDGLMGIENKDDLAELARAWIFELAELDAIRRRDASKVKAFLTRQTDRYRPPYGRSIIEVPRRCAFASSVNPSQWANDPTGARRFWPVKCVLGNPAALAAARDQLWAEAVHRMRAGEVAWLETDVLNNAAAEQAEERFQADPWEQQVTEYAQGRGRVTIPEVLERLGVETSRQSGAESNRVGAILRRMGYTPKRSMTARFWEPSQP